MTPAEPDRYLVGEEDAGERLDVFLTRKLPEISRSQIARSLARVGATVSGQPRKGSYRIQAGEIVLFAPPAPQATGPQPENVTLDVLFEDDEIAVINKPVGMVVHPAKGHWQGTLASALSGRYAHLSDIGGDHRPGIVHRLDRDTSGVIVVALTNRAHHEIARQFASREVKKHYTAFTRGEPNYDRDWIDQPIAPHPKYRERMSVQKDHPLSRDARSFYEVIDRFHGYCQMRVEPYTGRTHQIRVHLAFLGTPILCDPLYGDSRPLSRTELLLDRQDPGSPATLDRLALHAERIQLKHPTTGVELEFHAPLPSALSQLQEILHERRAHRSPRK